MKLLTGFCCHGGGFSKVSAVLAWLCRWEEWQKEPLRLRLDSGRAVESWGAEKSSQLLRNWPLAKRGGCYFFSFLALHFSQTFFSLAASAQHLCSQAFPCAMALSQQDASF